jgi:hypothetical protein
LRIPFMAMGGQALARLSGFDPQNREYIFSDHVVSMGYRSVSP